MEGDGRGEEIPRGEFEGVGVWWVEMKIYMYGINHFDPLCREKLYTNLESLSKSETSLPIFIGIEWDQSTHEKIVKQRKPFQELLESEGITTETVSAMASTLGFEGDTHSPIFPNVRTLWLDSEREDAKADEINNFYVQRYKIYKSYLKNLQNPTEILEVLSKKAWEFSRISDNNYRDKKWFDVIARNRGENGWAIVIVGANHCSDDNGVNLYQLLKDKEFEVVTQILG